ncbi:hypothetical protein BDV12DRAFT_204586 [Aspergillus spectabilis]
MAGRIFATFVAFAGISSALAVKYRLKRDKVPSFPYDPDTTSHCTWWWDNDGSIPCEEMPITWEKNPSVTETCGNFLVERSYCVEAFGEPESTTTQPPTTTTATTTTAGPPGPTQPGQIGTCNWWDLVQSGDSCNTYIQKYPGLTLADLVEWNSEIGAQCQFLWIDYYICTGVSGWVPTTTTSSTRAPPTNGVPTPTPTQPGMVDNCDEFHLVETGDDCSSIASEYRISTGEFFAWNSGVGTSCGSLWLGYYVCVSVVGRDTPTTTTTSFTTATTTTGPTNGVITPTLTRPGMVDNCDDFHMVVDGDYCASIASRYGISLAQFLEYNAQISADCSGLWLGYYVCVSIIGEDPVPTTTTTTTSRTTSTTTTTATGPSPTQSGLIETCTSYYQAQAGDTCQEIIQDKYPYINSLPLFVRWNPAVGSSCSNLLAGYYYCVATELHQPMPGIVANCRRYYQVKAGDTCWTIQQQYGITAAQFNRWNPLVGASCSSLWQRYFSGKVMSCPHA